MGTFSLEERKAESKKKWSAGLCCIEGCQRPEYCRGLCVNHYHYALRRIKMKKWSWEKLVRLYYARPSSHDEKELAWVGIK